jgi:PmbA protein
MSPEELADALIAAALRAGAEQADAIALKGEEVAIGAREGALEEAERSEAVDFGLRVLIGRRQACVSASDPRPETLRTLAERAAAMAREAPEDPYCGLPEGGALGAPIDAGALALVDPAPPPSPEALQALALRAEAAALAVEGVTQVEGASAAWRRGEVALAATNGFAGAYARTTATISVSAIAGERAGMERDYDFAARRRMDALPEPEAVGRVAGARAAARLGARKPPSGPAAVVFDRRVSPSLVGHVLAAANGAAVARGASWLLDRMGAPVLPHWAALEEDPLMAGGAASRPFDGEGVGARARPVVEGGRLTRWLLDSATGRKLGLETTGNARRGPSAPPSPGASNVRLTGGRETREGLIRGVERGFLVTSLIGASVNPTTGAYSRGASGFWIERGEIAYPVAEATIAGSLPEFLLTLEAADDPDPQLAISAPTVRVDGLVVA